MKILSPWIFFFLQSVTIETKGKRMSRNFQNIHLYSDIIWCYCDNPILFQSSMQYQFLERKLSQNITGKRDFGVRQTDICIIARLFISSVTIPRLFFILSANDIDSFYSSGIYVKCLAIEVTSERFLSRMLLFKQMLTVIKCYI